MSEERKHIFKVYTARFGVVEVHASDWVMREGGIYFYNGSSRDGEYIESFASGEWWRVRKFYSGEFTSA